MKYKHHSFSSIIAVGNITAEPKLMTDGTPFLSFQIAVDEFFKDRNSEQQRRTHFFGVVAYGDVAERAYKEIAKGAPVLVEGRLRSDEMGQGERKERKTRIHATKVKCLAWLEDDGNREQRPPSRQRAQPPRYEDEEDCPF